MGLAAAQPVMNLIPDDGMAGSGGRDRDRPQIQRLEGRQVDQLSVLRLAAHADEALEGAAVLAVADGRPERVHRGGRADEARIVGRTLAGLEGDEGEDTYGD